MAVVFISPKQKQKTFFVIITVVVLLFVLFVFFGVFVSAPQKTTQTLVFNKPKVTINIKTFDSEEFKSLQPFPEIENNYSYTALTKDNKTETGFVAAASEEAARKKLANNGLDVQTLKLVEVGRTNPFTPYYETVFTPSL